MVFRCGEMVLAAKTDNLILIPGAYRVKKRDPTQTSCPLTSSCVSRHGNTTKKTKIIHHMVLQAKLGDWRYGSGVKGT